MTGPDTAPATPSPPAVVVLDVNETLSDMAPLAGRFVELGASPLLAATWFAALLRDGFALAAAGASAPFAQVGTEVLRTLLAGEDLDRSLDDAVDHVRSGFAELDVHPDVPDGLRALTAAGLRVVTLSNGSASVARRLLTRAGVAQYLELMLSVEDAGVWKPAPGAYAYAAGWCGVDVADLMLVAVHPWDVDGAARAGLRTAWVNRTGSAYPAHFRRPDVEVASLGQLARRLRSRPPGRG